MSGRSDELSDEQIEDVKTVFFATEKSHGVAGSGRLSGTAVAKGLLSLGLDAAVGSPSRRAT